MALEEELEEEGRLACNYYQDPQIVSLYLNSYVLC